MTENIDRLIAMLEPEADEETVLFVRSELRRLVYEESTADFSFQRRSHNRNPDVSTNTPVKAERSTERSDQQKVDVYEVKVANDPIDW